MSFTVNSSTVVSPFNKKQSRSSVANVGLIVVLRIPLPLTCTPVGTTNGNVSVYSPGRIITVSPTVATLRA